MQVQRIQNNNISYKGNVVATRELGYAIHQAKSIKELQRFQRVLENVGSINDGKKFLILEEKEGTYLYLSDNGKISKKEKLKNKKAYYSDVLNRFCNYLEKLYPQTINREQIEKNIWLNKVILDEGHL